MNGYQIELQLTNPETNTTSIHKPAGQSSIFCTKWGIQMVKRMNEWIMILINQFLSEKCNLNKSL